MNEFSLIRHYFTGIGVDDPDVALAVGDDAALLHQAGEGYWAVAADMLVEGRHFPVQCNPALIAGRALRVNLSDMAAMGARPRFYTLSISLPKADTGWLQEFSDSLQRESRQFSVSLVGGDTTAGPLSLSIQMIGEVQKPLLRSAADAGDDIWVTGHLGSAAAYVAKGFPDAAADDFAFARFWQPEPRIGFALQAAPHIKAAIDVSDGLWADLGHICERSGLGARVEMSRLPLHAQLRQCCGDECEQLALTGGDDYELCFTAAPGERDSLQKIAAQLQLPLTRIGETTQQREQLCLNSAGKPVPVAQGGYQHF